MFKVNAIYIEIDDLENEEVKKIKLLVILLPKKSVKPLLTIRCSY